MFIKLRMAAIACLFALPCFASETLKELSLEEKIGQLLMVHFHGNEANEDARILIQKLHVGGIIYYNWANGLISPRQVRNLSNGLQDLAKENRISIPLLIAVDQEGGLVARLNKGFTIFPGNKALGMTGETKLAELSAYAIGQELGAVGVNMNLSPVVDVNSNPRNPVIGIRSFGDTIDIVLPFARSALKGYSNAGIITSIKHFPGHGDVEVDSHENLPVVKKSKEQLEKVELLPFYQLADQADSIMTAHIMVPSIDDKNCATLSRSILDILRKEVGFKGVIISDSLVMQGVLKNCNGSLEEAAIRAFNAGCDILILGGKQLVGGNESLELTVSDIQNIHRALVKAVHSGRISRQRLDEAVQKILDLKNRYSLHVSKEKEQGEMSSLINTIEHQALAKKIASLSVKTVKIEPITMPPLSQCKLAIFAPEIARDSINETSLLRLGKETCPLFFSSLNPKEEEISEALEMGKKADVLIFCSYNAWKNKAQADLIQGLVRSHKPLILIVLRDPLDGSLFSNVGLILTTFGPTTPSIQAACDLLCQ